MILFFFAAGLRLLAQQEALNGVIRHYYANGRLESVISYVNGRMHGPYFTYTESGTPLEAGSYAYNTWVGKFYHYNDDGSLQLSFTYNHEGKRQGIQRYYYPNGLLQMMSKLHNNVQQGYFLEFDSLGQLEEEPVYYVDGVSTDYVNEEELRQMLEIARRENELRLGRPHAIFSRLSK